MSDKYAPNLNRDEMEKILREEDVGRLAMSRDDEPYCVPLNYAYLDGEVVFHCSMQGRKLDFIRTNPRVCFEVDRHPDPMKPHHGDEGCNYRFESVVCFGTARILDDFSERRECLQRFQEYFNARRDLPEDHSPVTEERAQTCGCVVITVDEMTGRRKD